MSPFDSGVNGMASVYRPLCIDPERSGIVAWMPDPLSVSSGF
jgi:hypothetical protein